MRVFPDKGLTTVAIILAVLSAGLLISAACWLILLAFAVCAAGIVWRDYAWLRRNATMCCAAMDVPASGQRGEPVKVTVRIDNPQPVHMTVDVRSLLPAQGFPAADIRRMELKPATESLFPLEIAAPVRGAYEFGDLFVRVHAPRRMLQAQRCIANALTCKVYPDVQRVRDYLISRRINSAFVPHVRRTALRGVGSEFEGLRDYEPGDDVRRIDWKATAKHQRLITRNYEIESFRNVLVMVDRGRLMAAQAGTGIKLDHAIDASLMLMAVTLESGDHAGVMVFDKQVSAYLPPRGGPGQLNALIEAVYDTQAVFDETDFLRAFAHLQVKLLKRSMVVVLTDVVDAEVSRNLLEGMLALSRRHLVVFAALRTPAVYETAAAPANNALAPFRKAAAYRLAKERTEVISRLRKGGIHVLDVDPAGITIPLVNKYVELREQNRL